MFVGKLIDKEVENLKEKTKIDIQKTRSGIPNEIIVN